MLSVTPSNQVAGKYAADWSSLDTRPIPEWFDQAKFGIFIHWGIYSVPSWSPKRNTVDTTGEAYAEWYGMLMQRPESAFHKHHMETYGPRFKYQDFAPMFKAEHFDPEFWANLFKTAGAQYVVLTAKHHDGFCLWPSEYAWNWNSVDIGPHRDLVGEVKAAVEAVGLKMGLYYSLSEWFHPLVDAAKEPLERQTDRYVVEHMIPQLKELIERYSPQTLFTDGEWTNTSSEWRSEEFLAWLFNESKPRATIAVNDRWGSDTRSRHGGYYTTEYGEVGFEGELAQDRKWEENRGIGNSYGYSRNEDVADYLSEGELIHLLVDTVCKGGNLCLNVGPTPDGRIAVIQQERLLQIGEWLKVNGEAIYSTRPCEQQDGAPMTTNGSDVFCFFHRWPDSQVLLNVAYCRECPQKATILGMDSPLEIQERNGKLLVSVPCVRIDDVPCRAAYVIKVTQE